jgi:hypothetical protein
MSLILSRDPVFPMGLLDAVFSKDVAITESSETRELRRLVDVSPFGVCMVKAVVPHTLAWKTESARSVQWIFIAFRDSGALSM